MNKIFLVMLCILLLFSQTAGALTIDTNLIKDIQKSSETDMQTETVPERQLPNSYLSSGKIEPEPEETVGRRFDLLFFIALPVAYYLTLNIMQIFNSSVFNSSQLPVFYENYIYWNTLFVPMIVAFNDQVYIQEQKKIKLNSGFADFEMPEPSISVNLLSYRF